jgi:hypothetical protein
MGRRFAFLWETRAPTPIGLQNQDVSPIDKRRILKHWIMQPHRI